MAKKAASGKEQTTSKPKPEPKPEVQRSVPSDQDLLNEGFLDEEDINSEDIEGTAAPDVELPGKIDDGFKAKPGGNVILEEWQGRISIDQDEEGEVTGKSFIPQEKKHDRRKMLQKEADELNFASANTPHFSIAFMYLKPGEAKHGQRMNVNNIVKGAWRKKKKRND